MCAKISHQLEGINLLVAASVLLLIVGTKVYLVFYGLIWVLWVKL